MVVRDSSKNNRSAKDTAMLIKALATFEDATLGRHDEHLIDQRPGDPGTDDGDFNTTTSLEELAAEVEEPTSDNFLPVKAMPDRAQSNGATSIRSILRIMLNGRG